jgi:hypothetical protein
VLGIVCRGDYPVFEIYLHCRVGNEPDFLPQETHLVPAVGVGRGALEGHVEVPRLEVVPEPLAYQQDLDLLVADLLLKLCCE